MYTVIYSYSISQNQYPNSISIIVLYCIVFYCFIYRFNNGFTNVNNHPISIDSNHSIVSLSNPILLFMMMIIMMIILSKQFPINIEQILVQTYSNHHLYIIIIIIIIGRLDSSFVNVQYVIIGSLVIMMIIMMIENNDWLIDWLKQQS